MLVDIFCLTNISRPSPQFFTTLLFVISLIKSRLRHHYISTGTFFSNFTQHPHNIFSIYLEKELLDFCIDPFIFYLFSCLTKLIYVYLISHVPLNLLIVDIQDMACPCGGPMYYPTVYTLRRSKR